MQRREFFSWLSISALASSLSVVIAACSESSSSKNSLIVTKETSSEPSSIIRPDGFIVVGTVAELKESEQIIDFKNELIVIKNPSNNHLSALNIRCTHEGCPVGWDKTTQLIICPCHGSQYNHQGEVIQGPAGSSLKTYLVKEENHLVLVKLS